MIDIEKFKDIGEEWMEWTFTKRPTKLWVDTDYGRAVIDTKELAGTTASWYLEEEIKLMAEAPKLLVEVKRLREVMRKIGCSLCDECGLSIEKHIRYHTENDVIDGCPFGED